MYKTIGLLGMGAFGTMFAQSKLAEMFSFKDGVLAVALPTLPDGGLSLPPSLMAFLFSLAAGYSGLKLIGTFAIALNTTQPSKMAEEDSKKKFRALLPWAAATATLIYCANVTMS